MQVIETLSDGLKRGYSIVVPAADIESRRSERLAELAKTVRLPGFRPGKVPATVVRQRFGQAVNAEVVEESVQEATRQVLNERKLRSAGAPQVEVQSLPEARQSAPKDLAFTVALELLPEIALPDLSALSLTRLRAEPAAEVIDRALGELARRQRTLEEVTEPRPAAAGDVLSIDYAGTIDGVAFAGGTATDADVEVAGPGFIPGFTEQLVGLSAGESRTLDVSFPADYGSADVAGKAAVFAVTAKKLKRALIPAVDEALAENLGFEGGLSEVRAAITAQAQREYDQMSRQRLKRELLDALAGVADFPVPQGLLEAEFGQIWARVEADQKAGRSDSDDAGKDEATLRGEYRAIAERRVRLGLLLSEIGRVNEITVGQDEMMRAMRAEAARYQGMEQKVMDIFRKNPEAAESLRAPIFEEKVIDFVIERAQVAERVVSPEELARDPGLPEAVSLAGRAPAEAAAEVAAPAPDGMAPEAGQMAGSEG